MGLSDVKRDVVDSDVRAYVSNLVMALGGGSVDGDDRYLLGDDALACLRDLKRWLKLYDEKYNRYDVARCLAESNLVGGDLLQILAAWPEHAPDDKMKFKTSLACLELLVPLTWPIESDTDQMTENHHRHIPYLQIAHLSYKRSIINFDGARILHTAVRCALPSIAVPIRERTTRDEGIIKLLLYFIRNIALIAPPSKNFEYEHESEISRSALIDAFNYQDILHFLLTISSTMGEDFNTQDVIILDIIFHILKGINVDELFWDEQKENDYKIQELKRLRKKEASMLSSYQRHAPTRHNRFGTMAWIQTEDAKIKTVTGQAAIVDSAKSLAKIDSTKQFRLPQRPFKGEKGPLEFDTPALLNVQAKKHLRTFVLEFLDSCFNPFFDHIRKAIDREADRVLEYHQRQFFYLVNWFLQAERKRRCGPAEKLSKKTILTEEDISSFSLVASVLNQEMFATLNKTMLYTFENKMWSDLSASLKCFSQIILTVQDMINSPQEEDQEIAANILNRIFYENITHDLIASVTRTYKDQGFGYLDSVTEVAYNYLRILEYYSKDNTDLQVRSKKKGHKKKKLAAAASTAVNQGLDDADETDDVNDDKVMSKQVSYDRKLDFKRFSSRFATQGCVDTFVIFTSYYHELKPTQLKRAHRFFYRLAFKNDMSILLFRVDIIELLHRMVKGPEGLDSKSADFREWEELVRQILKKCIRKVQERPELIVEMLFSKTNSIAQFLEYGYDKQVSTTKRRATTELEVTGGKEWDEQIGIVISVMLDKNEETHLHWLKSELVRAEMERRNWENSNQIIPSIETNNLVEEVDILTSRINKQDAPSIPISPDTITSQIALSRNGLLRLLMKLVGLHELNDGTNLEASWFVPSSLSANELQNALDLIIKFEFSPPVFDNGQEAADFIGRKRKITRSRMKTIFGDEDDDILSDDQQFFEPGGPTTKNPDMLDTARKRKRGLWKSDGVDDSEVNDFSAAQLEAQIVARKKLELEKNRKIKSALYVRHSDDESDEERDREFFEQEEKLRQKNKARFVDTTQQQVLDDI